MGRKPLRGQERGRLLECLECRCADLDGWETGGMAALKTLKAASRTLKSGRAADGVPGRGRPAREADEKRKTREHANVFYNLTSSGRCDLQIG